jgi:hypothetical protein
MSTAVAPVRSSSPSILSSTLSLQTVTRTITKQHYLRPIPQGQIDGLEMTDDEKAAYQNPGY